MEVEREWNFLEKNGDEISLGRRISKREPEAVRNRHIRKIVKIKRRIWGRLGNHCKRKNKKKRIGELGDD